MHSMDNQQQDPSAMLGNLVQLQQMQRLNEARPGMVSALSGGGTGGGTGIDPSRSQFSAQ